MKTSIIALVLLLSPLAAAGQEFPNGFGELFFKERFKVSGCPSSKDEDSLSFTANGDGTFSVDAFAGSFSGAMTPKDTKGLKWLLQFDVDSLADYIDYLEDVGTILCQTSVVALFVEIQKFEAKFKKDMSEVRVKLKTRAAGQSAFGTGRGRHSLKGKGGFTPDL